MQLWVILAIVLVLVVAVGARWLFRQRNPEEVRAARERLRQWRDRP
jgi:septation ring formation regulator EzrA